MINKIKIWKEKHPDFYEFILFNIMSNVATITNFVVLWLGNGIFFKALKQQDFNWFIFHYQKENGGLTGFLSFLLAYICAQVVNFVVQRKVVFGANCKIVKVLPWYILTVTVAGIISIWMPPYIIALTQSYLGDFAPTLANAANIFVQVLINYPMLKLVIMKKEK